MRLPHVVLCLVLTFAAGCSSVEWVNANDSKADYAIDYRKCEEEGSNNPKFQGGMQLILQEYIDRCMKKTGWRFRERRDRSAPENFRPLPVGPYLLPIN